MDKRWIGIILILFAGLGCMYFIVSTSTTVGSAVSVIDDVTITLPSGYITTEDTAHSCVLFDKKTNETIRIKTLNDANSYKDEYTNKLKTLKGESDIKITKTYINDTLSMIEYENQTSNDKNNITQVYFDKCNHTFSMQLEHFTSTDSKENTINFIIDNLKYDFKQNKA